MIAATCRSCGRLCSGQAFKRHRRKARDPRAYYDFRCPPCKIGMLEVRLSGYE